MSSQASTPPALLVTIDGPAGAGKTTVSRMLARRLAYRYVDTGALYRCLAVAAQEAGISAEDDAALEALCRETRLDLESRNDAPRLLLNGRDVTHQLRTPQITMLASAISARPVVRAFLLEIQRSLGHAGRAVFEGRDMGTVVFPDADVKFFLSADPAVRARRRHRELQARTGQGPSLASVENDMRRRDRNDSTRESAPLKPAVDAIQIDSTHMAIEEVVDFMMVTIQNRRVPSN